MADSLAIPSYHFTITLVAHDPLLDTLTVLDVVDDSTLVRPIPTILPATVRHLSTYPLPHVISPHLPSSPSCHITSSSSRPHSSSYLRLLNHIPSPLDQYRSRHTILVASPADIRSRSSSSWSTTIYHVQLYNLSRTHSSHRRVLPSPFGAPLRDFSPPPAALPFPANLVLTPSRVKPNTLLTPSRPR